MPHDLGNTVALLARTPRALDALLRDLPEVWTHAGEGENTWTARDVVGHLIHADETDWLVRARTLLQYGETRELDPFDRFGHRQIVEGHSLAELLDELARVRDEKLRDLRALGLSASDLDRRGRHPAFGPVTLSELLATWAAHDLTHLHQISRVMAHQYASVVGPWREYLGVLQCAGHGN